MDRLDQPHRRCSALGLDAPWGGTQGAPVRVTALWEGTGFLTSTCPLSHLGVGPHLLLHLLQSHCAAAQITEGLKSRAGPGEQIPAWCLWHGFPRLLPLPTPFCPPHIPSARDVGAHTPPGHAAAG